MHCADQSLPGFPDDGQVSSTIEKPLVDTPGKGVTKEAGTACLRDGHLLRIKQAGPPQTVFSLNATD
jgi:hypothetical protein